MKQEIPLEQLLKEKIISQRTYDKVIVAKNYIERRYNLQTAKNMEWNEIMNQINSLQICQEEKQKIKKEIYNQEVVKYRKLREKQTIRDYESLAIIGRGAFGEVHVCREKKTGKICAIKKIKKYILVVKNQIRHVLNEQILMSKASSPWIVELMASFQEDDYLYLVMEYLPGGDLMNLLIQKDTLTEKEAKFYISELILAIEAIHKLDCIHRDIKPDNILIDKDGHIKLSDFGLAKISDKLYEKEDEKYKNFLKNKKSEKNDKMTHNKNFSCVGTAYYVAPEVLNKKGYEEDIDWWSVGIIFYEMLMGYAPFCSKETSEVCYKVLNWKDYLIIPNKFKISDEAKDLIFKMINNSSDRLGKNGAEEIKKHPFFKDVDWDNIRNTKAPFIPKLKNDYDTKYFEKFDEIEPFYPKNKNKYKRKDVEYVGYDFNKDNFENDLKTEYEQAIKTINYELKKEKTISEENNKYDDENIDINIKLNSYKNLNRNNDNISDNNSKKNTLEEKVIMRGKPKIPFKRSSILNEEGKIPKQNDFNIKLIKLNTLINNAKNKDNKIWKHQCTIPISYHKKNKLNIIQLPQKKNRPKIYLSSKIRNLINNTQSNKNTFNNLDDSANTSNNHTFRSMRSNNNIEKYNNIPISNVKYSKNDRMKIGVLFTSLKRMPSPHGNIFFKKFINTGNIGLSKEKYIIRNKSVKENNNCENCRLNIKSKSKGSSKCIHKQSIINLTRNINNKNNSLIKENSISSNKINISINRINKRNHLSHDKNKSPYIYQRKK